MASHEIFGVSGDGYGHTIPCRKYDGCCKYLSHRTGVCQSVVGSCDKVTGRLVFGRDLKIQVFEAVICTIRIRLNQTDRTDQRTGRCTSRNDRRGLIRIASICRRNAIGTRNAGMRAIASDEIHQSQLMTEIVRIIHPTHIGCDGCILACRIEGPSSSIQSGSADITATRDIDGTEV